MYPRYPQDDPFNAGEPIPIEMTNRFWESLRRAADSLREAWPKIYQHNQGDLEKWYKEVFGGKAEVIPAESLLRLVASVQAVNNYHTYKEQHLKMGTPLEKLASHIVHAVKPAFDTPDDLKLSHYLFKSTSIQAPSFKVTRTDD